MAAAMEECMMQDNLSPALTIIERHSFSLLIETFLFVLYILLIVYLVSRPCATRKTKSFPTFILLYSLAMFALFCVYWALDIYYLWAEYHSLLSRCSGSLNGSKAQVVSWKGADWVDQDGLLPQYFTPVYVEYMVELILIVLGDFVSLWRAYVIFGRSRGLCKLLGCIAVVEGVMYIMICTSASVEYSSSGSISNPLKALDGARTPLTFAGYSVTVLAQLASTTLIAYKAWLHWRDVQSLAHRSSTRRGFTALAIIIESGVVYLVILTWYGIITTFGGSSSLLVYSCRFYCAPLIAMYPTLVVALVASRPSVLERSIDSGILSDVMSPHFSLSLTVPFEPAISDGFGRSSTLTSVVSLESRMEGGVCAGAQSRPLQSKHDY